MNINWKRALGWGLFGGTAAYLLSGEKGAFTAGGVAGIGGAILFPGDDAATNLAKMRQVDVGSVLTLEAVNARGGFPNNTWVSPNAPPYNVKLP